MKVRHKKRGTEYEVIGDASVQTSEFIAEGEQVVVYRGADGQLWVRPFREFHDGRFEPVAG